jgi:two-component system sensor histidine kinase/response regulator
MMARVTMLPSVKCLVVDDLQENLLAMSALLEQDGVEVLLAQSGAAALEILLVHDIALAFVDVQMPELDGFELAELMRGTERTRHVPIIFLTAGARDQVRFFKGYEIGAVDFLYKPVDPKILKNKADVFFQLNRQKQQLAMELHQRTEMLRLAEVFTAVLGHDLRNPLHVIISSADALKRKSAEPAVHEMARRIVTSGQLMNRMIADILDMARARLAGGIPIKRCAVDFREIVESVVVEYRSSPPTRELNLQRSGEFNGEWDADRIAQVASNLIGNALKHGDGDKPVFIELDGTNELDVRLRVTNSGEIAASFLSSVFDPFRSEQRYFSSHSGLGLGLYIVQQLTQAHRGEVDVKSTDNTTVFEVILPRFADSPQLRALSTSI